MKFRSTQPVSVVTDRRPATETTVIDRLYRRGATATALLFLLALATLSPAQTNLPPATNAVISSPPPTSAPGQPAIAGDPFSNPLIQQIEARHEKAVKGDWKETKALAADLEKWTKEQPGNHLLQAYLGSTYTLCSRDAWPGPGKLAYLENGGKLLDAAVAADPANPAVRFIRAIDYYELPTIFGKRKIARDDFEILIKQLEDPAQTTYALNTETAQAIYYFAGLSFYQLWQSPQARQAWQRGLQLDANSALGLKIQAELKKVK